MKLLSKIILTATIIFAIVFYIFYGDNWNLFYADALGYYSYLPSTFIYHNYASFESLPLDQGIPASVIDYFQSFVRDTPPAPSGNYMNRYTYGVALLQLLFFLLAHLYSFIFGLPMNGYTDVYHGIVRFSSLFYALLGLLILYKGLRYFFKKEVAIIATCLVLIGSNLFWFTFYQVGMSHAYLFFLHACLLLLTIKFYKKPSAWLAGGLGLLLGIITMTRQPDIIFFLLPILYGINSWATLKERAKFAAKHWRFVGLGAWCFVLPVLPQLFIWKTYAGSFLYFSYTGQSFDWAQPHILAGLFGAQNGWLLYSPIFVIAFVGFFYKNLFSNLWLPIILLSILFIYIAYAWWCYQYIFGFGSRPMLSLYPLLAFPLAALLSKASEWKIWKQALLFLLLLTCVLYNLNLTRASVEERIQTDETNATFLKNTFYKTSITYNDLILLDIEEQQPIDKNLHEVKKIGMHDFENLPLSEFIIEDTIRQSTICRIAAGEEYAPITLRDTLTNELDGDYLKCTADIKVPKFYSATALLYISVRRGQNSLLWKGIKINNKLRWQEAYCTHKKLSIKHGHENKWSPVHFYTSIKNLNLQKGDIIEYGIWNVPKAAIYFDNLGLSVWEE